MIKNINNSAFLTAIEVADNNAVLNRQYPLLQETVKQIINNKNSILLKLEELQKDGCIVFLLDQIELKPNLLNWLVDDVAQSIECQDILFFRTKEFLIRHLVYVIKRYYKELFIEEVPQQYRRELHLPIQEITYKKPIQIVM